MGARGLTAKQQRFAELLASGTTKVDAFRQAYPSDRRGKGTAWEGAKRVARHPAVAAEVQRLTLLRSPHDAAAQAEHIAARLLELTKNPEPAVALRAIAQWGKLAEAGLLKPPPGAAKQGNVAGEHNERARIIDELRGLYEKALGPSWPQRNELILSIKAESIQETDDQSEDDAALLDARPPGSRVEEPLQSLADSPIDQEEVGGPMPSEVLIDAAPESLEPGDYDLVAIPGRFPVQFRRVPR
jgi:hypothetical protein